MLTIQQQTQDLIYKISKILIQNKQKLAVAESCTGGGLAYALTSIAGSSTWFDRGFVTYSNHAKQELLAVEQETIQECGVVSEEVVIEMAEGVLDNSNAEVAVSITGIAGPDGGSEEKPVGTVYFGLLVGDMGQIHRECFDGDRASVREQAIIYVLEKLLEMLSAE